MALISMRGISVGFGGPLVLDNLTFQIERGERVCLSGRNGEGKSTLLSVISGDVSPDTGDIIRQPGLRIGYLSQETPPTMQGTVFDVVAGHHHIQGNQSIPTSPNDDDAEWRVERVLSQLQIEPTASFETLSGGVKRRVLLARALADHPDILLLDEPTNHLDIDAITWLETFLLRQTQTLMFVTHDRMLLRKLATRIVELDRGRLADWACDYNTFLQRKQAMLEVEAEQWAQFDKKLAQEEIWIRQGIRARRTRNEGRVRALQQLRATRQARREQPGTARLQVQEAERSGNLVIEARNVSFRYDATRPLIENFSTIIMRGDKIGILGPNGSGKTTLLRLLLQQLTPQHGTVRLGTRLEVVYSDQLRAQLDDHKTVQENVAAGNDTIIFNGQPRHVLSYLQDFLFVPERARSPVRILSGGERNRLLLAKLFTRPSNVLLLDEPTNDLDAETLELLEELLLAYTGTVLLVSHDRAFLNHVVTSTMVLEGNGRVREYVGGYDDWLRQRQLPMETKPKAPPSKSRPVANRPRKLTYKEQRELEELPLRIETLEEEQGALYQAMTDPTFYRQNSDDIVTIKTKLAALEKTLHDAYARWEELEDLPR